MPSSPSSSCKCVCVLGCVCVCVCVCVCGWVGVCVGVCVWADLLLLRLGGSFSLVSWGYRGGGKTRGHRLRLHHRQRTRVDGLPQNPRASVSYCLLYSTHILASECWSKFVASECIAASCSNTLTCWVVYTIASECHTLFTIYSHYISDFGECAARFLTCPLMPPREKALERANLASSAST